MDNTWIARRPLKKCARLRLFCLPYAGGSAAIYHRWHAAFPQNVDLCPIELPGRIARLKEPPFSDLPALIKALHEGVAALLDVPFAFFGYSMGALIAYEWARELMRRGERSPERLIVAARGAPHLPPAFVHDSASASDEQVIANIFGRYGQRLQAVLAEPDMRTIVLGIMRADLTLLDSYVYQGDGQLSVPIAAIGGEHDPLVARDSLRAWNKVTSANFSEWMLAGDHFFIDTDRGRLIQIIQNCLGISNEPKV
ncbi:MAG TPA: thioesterase domain-containing protein [Polyangiaceae bacterium]|nr:thioesterase domain-containing protein [Polyangiaceae bacterium]